MKHAIRLLLVTCITAFSSACVHTESIKHADAPRISTSDAVNRIQAWKKDRNSGYLYSLAESSGNSFNEEHFWIGDKKSPLGQTLRFFTSSELNRQSGGYPLHRDIISWKNPPNHLKDVDFVSKLNFTDKASFNLIGQNIYYDIVQVAIEEKVGGGEKGFVTKWHYIRSQRSFPLSEVINKS